MTDRYAVIGNPIAQSKSPWIHSAFAQVTGQDIDYGKLLGPLGEFAATVGAFRASGGRGMNVTAPFKLDAFAYATDLATGLPHQAQLLEHMTQLLALREREPAPMVLLVLRVDGFARAAARLGVESGNVLRRKVAVRLRSGLRASDVVASIGPDAFGVLLGRLEAKGDGERVAAKLVKSLQLPILVAGEPCDVAAQVGLAIYPEHGKDAESLMQRASAQAGSVATVGRAGFASQVQRIDSAAANDSGP